VFDVGIKDDHLVFVTEYLEGETAEAWIDEHGPMPADAVLRIGLQVMNALTAAANHSLTDRSIQPANLIIIPGAAPVGRWAWFKLVNLSLAWRVGRSDREVMVELVP